MFMDLFKLNGGLDQMMKPNFGGIIWYRIIINRQFGTFVDRFHSLNRNGGCFIIHFIFAVGIITMVVYRNIAEGNGGLFAGFTPFKYVVKQFSLFQMLAVLCGKHYHCVYFK